MLRYGGEPTVGRDGGKGEDRQQADKICHDKRPDGSNIAELTDDEAHPQKQDYTGSVGVPASDRAGEST